MTIDSVENVLLAFVVLVTKLLIELNLHPDVCTFHTVFFYPFNPPLLDVKEY